MANPALLALLLVLALLALIPARRLHLAGWSGRAVLVYYLGLLVVALAAVELRGLGRFLVPILVVAYVAPFVTVDGGLGRLLGARRAEVSARRAPPKDVTPPTLLDDGERRDPAADD
jgi:hypothetical protein